MMIERNSFTEFSLVVELNVCLLTVLQLTLSLLQLTRIQSLKVVLKQMADFKPDWIALNWLNMI